MKNIISGLVVGTCLIASSSVMAATALSAGSSSSVATANCTLLSESVTVNLSSNVSAAYECYEATSDIRIATCHKGGSRKETTASCEYTACDAANEDGSQDNCTSNDTSCGTSSPATGTEVPTFTYVDYSAFVASSTGGSVAKSQLGGSCDVDGATAAGLAFFN